jgi:hypothetical protein
MGAAEPISAGGSYATGRPAVAERPGSSDQGAASARGRIWGRASETVRTTRRGARRIDSRLGRWTGSDRTERAAASTFKWSPADHPAGWWRIATARASRTAVPTGASHPGVPCVPLSFGQSRSRAPFVASAPRRRPERHLPGGRPARRDPHDRAPEGWEGRSAPTGSSPGPGRARRPRPGGRVPGHSRVRVELERRRSDDLEETGR